MLKGIDELMALLDEHVTMTQAMLFSPFKKPFEERIDDWELKLRTTSDVLEVWVQVQRSWLYLQPIFDSPDINKQLPKEGKRFSNVDRGWRKHMQLGRENPKAIEFLPDQELLDFLQEANAVLDLVQKGLSEYLETKRAAFSRFYFLANDELLEILSETKDPTRAQPHFKKCFEGLNKVSFLENDDISAMISAEKERVEFTGLCVSSGESPNGVVTPSRRNIEDWMTDLEEMMRLAVKDHMNRAIKDYSAIPRTEWMLKWPGMVVLNGSQVHWTREVEADFDANGSIVESTNRVKAQLGDMVRLVRGNLGKGQRTTVGALTVLDVHARDLMLALIDEGVADKGHFRWISQMRFSWEEDKEPWENIPSNVRAVKESGDGNLWVEMVAARRAYGYECVAAAVRQRPGGRGA